MPVRSFSSLVCVGSVPPSNRAPDQPLIAVTVEDDGVRPAVGCVSGRIPMPLADDGLVSNHFSIEPTGNMGLDEGTW